MYLRTEPVTSGNATPRPIGLFSIPLSEPEFRLDDEFLDQYHDRPVAWGPVGWITYKRTYSRFQHPEHGGAFRLTPVNQSEEWWETVARVVEGVYQIQQRHCQFNGVRWDAHKAQRSAQEMYERIFTFKFTPPGRGLWMMGTDFVRTRGSACLQNCAFVSTERLAEDPTEPFLFLMDLSMLGVGVGADTKGAGTVNVYEPMRTAEGAGDRIIKDSREGWCEAVETVLGAYLGTGARLPAKWRYDSIRPEGTPIRGFGGVAAGPEPLRKLIEDDIPSILDPLVGKKITSEAIVDIFNSIGRCVVAGNVRRSAEIMLGDPSDETFLTLKDPEVANPRMFGDDTWRWCSNNSILATEGMDYERAGQLTARNGEPGYFWMDNARAFGRLKDAPDYRDWRVVGVNPCVEQSLENFELCCLVETFPALHEDLDDYKRTLKFAYLYAKTVTLLPTHIPKTNAVMMRNRRIGCSMSGIVQNFQRVGFREHMRWCDEGYGAIQRWDEIYAEWLGVPRSIKTTSVKPSGSVSKLCAATSGCHYPISEFYIQRITLDVNHALVGPLREAGYPIEDSVYSPGRTVVVEIPVREANFYKSEDDATMWEQLENAAALQHVWADNQVSCTVKFDQTTEGPDIPLALERYESRLKGISFLPKAGAAGYRQAPWETITAEEYERRSAALKPIRDTRRETADTPERFCDGASCTV